MTNLLKVLQQMLEHASQSNVPHVQVMKNTVENSSWHREANVWVHTQSVVSEFIKIWDSEMWPEDSRAAFVTGVACLFHDFGKPDAEQTLKNKEGVEYRRYAGHESISASEFRLFATDGAKWQELFGVELDLSVEEVYVIALMIQHHLPYQYKSDMVHAIFDTVNKFLPFGRDMFFNMLRADARGRISDDHPAKLQAVEDWISAQCEDYVPGMFHGHGDRLAYVVIGPSGSGKSTLVDEHWALKGAPCLNMDSIRLEAFGDPSITDPAVQYSDAFQKSCDSKNEFNGIVQQKMSQLLSSSSDVVISDNMNLSKKSRRAFIAAARQSKRTVVGVVLCGVGLAELQRRAKTRGNRQIPPQRIEDMFKSLYLPALDEFDDIVIK